MPEPAGSAELAQLRDLLVGPERDELAQLQARLADPVQRSADLAQLLPEAIKAARSKNLREALEPVFEKAFQSSVRKHPKDLADAIYPVIGPAIRNSITASIREFAENLNQIVEKSASLRALRWRIEARVTGKPFTEILLARSLLYSVEQVFLIHRRSGLLLQHVTSQASVLKDADMIAGMLTAIQDFFSDSFTEGGQDLETVDTGRYKLWIQYGPKALVVGAVSGTAPAELKSVFRNAIDQTHQQLYAELDSFKQGDTAVFEPARPLLEACLLGHAGSGAKRKTLILWLIAGAFVLLIGGFFWYSARQQARWDAWLSNIRHQPGIVVTDVEKRGSDWVISGLKDPLAPEPAATPHVRYEWRPFLSLNTTFAAAREVNGVKDRIEKQFVRFEVGSSKLPMSEVARVEDVGVAIAELLRRRPGISVVVTGRADESGSPGTNDKLSKDRARNVIDALAAQGLPRDRMSDLGLGDQSPLRKGDTDFDRAANRSVVFKVKE